jgi:hypothetical protein
VNSHGGKRKGAGRKPGSLGRATADIKAIARPYGAPAIAELARLAGLTAEAGALSEQTRVAALRELLDRGFGRATQHIAGDADAGPVHFTFEWAPASPQPQADAPAIEGQLVSEAGRKLELVWEQDDEG